MYNELKLVTNEQAIILKQLGFNMPCHFYCENNKLKFHKHESGWDFNNSFLTCYSKPTHYQVFKWFRDKHKLIQSVHEGGVSTANVSSFEFYIDKLGNNGVSQFQEYVGFKLYEDAETDCINKLIKLIK